MGKSYSLDLRERVFAFVGCGGSRRQAAGHFDVSPSFAVKLCRRREKTGSLGPAKQGRPLGGGKLAGGRPAPGGGILPCGRWPSVLTGGRSAPGGGMLPCGRGPSVLTGGRPAPGGGMLPCGRGPSALPGGRPVPGGAA